MEQEAPSLQLLSLCLNALGQNTETLKELLFSVLIWTSLTLSFLLHLLFYKTRHETKILYREDAAF